MLIKLLDRPGCRYLLAKFATRSARRVVGEDMSIVYINGMWTHRIGRHVFPDSRTFNYTSSSFLRWSRQWESHIADTADFWLRHYSPKEGDVVIDVGAGRGEDLISFSNSVGKTGRVLAIEADPESFTALSNFCQLNHLYNVTAIQAALMDKAGMVYITKSVSSWMENSISFAKEASGTSVQAKTLDAIFENEGLRNIAFLKMNIEGAERFALVGMESTIGRVSQICVACHDFRGDRGEGDHFRTRAFVERFLTDRGFVLFSRREDPRDYVRDHVFGLKTRVASDDPE